MNIKSYLWNIIYPFFRKYYSIKLATTPEEKLDVYKFRYWIYRKELGHYFLDDELHDADYISDKYDDDINAYIIYAKHKNKIIGTLRVTLWEKDKFPNELQKKYYISDDIKNKFNQIGEFRFFQISSSYRTKFLALALISFANECIMKHSTAESIIFSDSQPGLLQYYLKMGCFTYSYNVIHERFLFLLIPFAYILFDLDYLKKNNSPTYHQVKKLFKIFKKRHPEIITRRNFKQDIPHINLYATTSEINDIRNSLPSDKVKLRFDYIIKLLKNILILRLKKDTSIITSGIVDYDIYMLLEGKLGVHLQDKLIAEINPGEMFGEISLISNEHKRTSDVRCLSNVKVMLIPRNLLTYLEKNNPKDAIQLLRLFSMSIAEKMLVSNSRAVNK